MSKDLAVEFINDLRTERRPINLRSIDNWLRKDNKMKYPHSKVNTNQNNRIFYMALTKLFTYEIL
ncbi:MAG TPA: hypothetical protein DCP78_12905 [Sphingobacterium sp.]|nr:hypothetical protein [Sphingobacterium sp.]